MLADSYLIIVVFVVVLCGAICAYASKSSYKIANLSYWKDFDLQNDKFTMRIAIPKNWQTDKKNMTESYIALLTPDGEDFNEAAAFLSVRIIVKNSESGVVPTIQQALDEIKASFLLDGWSQKKNISKITTYDARQISALSFQDNQTEYSRISVFIPLHEDPSYVLYLSLQVNSIDKSALDKYMPFIEDFIRSLRVQKVDIDRITRDDYIKDLLQKGCIKHFD